MLFIVKFSLLIPIIIKIILKMMTFYWFFLIKIRRSMNKPLFLLINHLFSKSPIFIPIFHPLQPLFIISSTIALLPRKYLKHTRLLISWYIHQTMSILLLLIVSSWRSLPHCWILKLYQRIINTSKVIDEYRESLSIEYQDCAGLLVGFFGHITPSPAGPRLSRKKGRNQVQLLVPNTWTQL